MKNKLPHDQTLRVPPHIDPDRVMQPEALNQIINAILDNRYSWACVLMLRHAGCNPLNYIPERTYRRLDTAHRSSPKKSSQRKSAKVAS